MCLTIAPIDARVFDEKINLMNYAKRGDYKNKLGQNSLAQLDW